MVQVITSVSHLRQQAISMMQVGEIAVQGRYLCFYLDNHEVKRLFLPQLVAFARPIFFNRNGITGGGRFQLQFSRLYTISIAAISGHITVE